MSIYILVHGAYHGAWCYAKVVPLLEAAGHTAIAVDLPGHGDNLVPMADVTLDNYADHVCGICGAQDGKVILIGHSLGGMTITQVAERMPERIDWLVYLTAMMPRNGETRADLARFEGDVDIASLRIVSGDGLSATMTPDSIRPTFYGECSDADYEMALAKLVPQATEPLQRAAATTPGKFGTVRRAYIECLRDHAIPIVMQRAMVEAQPCARVMTLDSDHSPFLSAPEKLVDHLLSL